MPIDPAQGFGLTDQERQAERLASLERRLSNLEHGAPVVQAGVGVPTSTPRDGTLYVDISTNRLWLRVAGVWRWSGFS